MARWPVLSSFIYSKVRFCIVDVEGLVVLTHLYGKVNMKMFDSVHSSKSKICKWAKHGSKKVLTLKNAPVTIY